MPLRKGIWLAIVNLISEDEIITRLNVCTEKQFTAAT